MNEVAYELSWEVSHYEDYQLDWDYDLEIQPFPGQDKTELDETNFFPIPESIVFKGALSLTRHIDYPDPNNGWPVMSRRMHETLTAVGQFPHRAIPVSIVDSDAWHLQRCLDAFGRGRTDLVSSNYLAVQLTEFADVFDWEKSKYTPHERLPGIVQRVDEYVFKVPPGGLPPLFRIACDRTILFISAEARAALKAAGIVGPRYISLRGYRAVGQTHTEEDYKDPLVAAGLVVRHMATSVGDFTDTPVIFPEADFVRNFGEGARRRAQLGQKSQRERVARTVAYESTL
jgi:hypothetical protein